MPENANSFIETLIRITVIIRLLITKSTSQTEGALCPNFLISPFLGSLEDQHKIALSWLECLPMSLLNVNRILWYRKHRLLRLLGEHFFLRLELLFLLH